MKINQIEITKKLSNLKLKEGSKLTNFIKREGGNPDSYRDTSEAYIISFFMMILSGGTTLLHWTLQFCKLLDGLTLTEQGLEKKLQFRQVIPIAIGIAKWLLLKSIQLQLKSNTKELEENNLTPQELPLNNFNRVLLQDSTCVNVPKNLAEFFPSSFTKKGVSATARVQLTMRLLSDNYDAISLGSFRDNDAGASADVLDIIQPNDLVLRDKGYWSLDVFVELDRRDCYFLSRLKYGVNLYDVLSKERIDLNKTLKKAKNNNDQIVDKQILIGAKHQLKVRLVAIRLPEAVAAERRRKAKQDRHSKTNHSEDYYERLVPIAIGRCIFITNIPKEILNGQQIVKIYRLRWRIEIIFKVWKSKFDFSKMFEKASMKPSRAIITFYLLLTWLTLFFTKLYNYFLIKVEKKTKRFISIFKFVEFLQIFMQDAEKQEQLFKSPDDFIDSVASSCLYDKRSRKNQMELIYC